MATYQNNIFYLENPGDSKPKTVDEALDFIGRGRFQYYVFISCGICLLATVMETIGISFAIPPALCELELDTFKKGILSSITFLGIASTSHVGGFLADEFGRKKTTFISLALSLFISALAALAPSYWMIVVLRFLSGMSISAASSTIYAYMSEFFPTHLRATSIMLGSSVAATASIIMPVVGLIVHRYHWEIPVTESYTVSPWRLQLLIQLLPGLLSLYLMKRLPESPKYLMSVNNEQDCLRVLRRMYEKNTGNSRYLFPIKQLRSASDHGTEDEHTSKRSLAGFCSAIIHETAMLFRPPHLGLILSCCFIQFGCFVVAAGFGLWYPEIMNRISEGDRGEMGFCEILDSKNHIEDLMPANMSRTVEGEECIAVVHESMYINNMYLGSAYVSAFLLLALGLNKISLKNTLTIMLTLGLISAMAIQHITNDILLVIAFCLFILSSGVSIPLVNATAVDLFPTNLRGMAISVSILIGRMGTFSGANAIGFFLDMNCGLTFYGMGVLILVCGIFSWLLPKKDHSKHNDK